MSKAREVAKMGEVLTNSQIGGRRNIIINGAMQVAQRGTSGFTTNAAYTLDRYKVFCPAAVGGFLSPPAYIILINIFLLE